MLIEPIELCSNLTFENILAKVAFKLFASSRYYWNSFAGVCMSCWAVGIGVSIHKVSPVELRVLGKCLNIWSNIIRCNEQLHLIIAAESCSFSIRLCITQSANWFDIIAAWICNILCDRASGRYTRYRVKRSIFGDENCNLSMRSMNYYRVFQIIILIWIRSGLIVKMFRKSSLTFLVVIKTN